jgi:hypothetical protein
LVEGTETKLIPPIAIQRTIGVQPFPYHGVGSLLHWEDKDTLNLTILNNNVDNFVISHIQSYNLTHGIWVELNKISESKNAVTKTFLR